MMNSQDTFFQLIRQGIGHNAGRISDEIDWNDIQSLAEQQGLSALVLDGVERLSENQRPPKEKLLQWIGDTLQSYEFRYEQYRKAIAELAAFYNYYGYKMMVLKGYACAMNWPKPEHRPCGDIDIWQFGKQKEADAILTKEKGIKIDESHHHHTVFTWRDFSVENHYDFIEVNRLKSNRELEQVFKELGEDDTNSIEVNGKRVYVPSPNLNALFLIRHMVSHFASEVLTLRQILDWAFFVKNHTREIDWQWLIAILEAYHMKDFFNTINAICVEDLGFDVSIFPIVQFLPSLKEKVIVDIINSSLDANIPKCFFPRLIYKYRRWQGNAWKQELCFKESRLSAFWSGVWSHMLKPKSI